MTHVTQSVWTCFDVIHDVLDGLVVVVVVLLLHFSDGRSRHELKQLSESVVDRGVGVDGANLKNNRVREKRKKYSPKSRVPDLPTVSRRGIDFSYRREPRRTCAASFWLSTTWPRRRPLRRRRPWCYQGKKLNHTTINLSIKKFLYRFILVMSSKCYRRAHVLQEQGVKVRKI